MATIQERVTTCLREQAEYRAKIKDLEPRIKTLEETGKDATLLRDDKKSAEKGLADENAKEITLNNLFAIEARALEAEKDRKYKILLKSQDPDSNSSSDDIISALKVKKGINPNICGI